MFKVGDIVLGKIKPGLYKVLSTGNSKVENQFLYMQNLKTRNQFMTNGSGFKPLEGYDKRILNILYSLELEV